VSPQAGLEREAAAAPRSRRLGVVIPTMDRPALLARALASVAAQRLAPRAVVVVDNGEQPAELPPTLREGIEILRTEPRIGSGRPRNLGTARLDTDWVAFLDDDDTWDPDYLAEIEAAIEAASETATARGGADVVVGSLVTLGEDGAERRVRVFPDAPAGQRQLYFRNPGFSGQNIAVRRDLFLSIGGFDERLPASVDRDLGVRLMQAGARIVVAPRARALVREHTGARITDRILDGNAAFLRKHWRHMRPGEILRAGRRILRWRLRRARGLPLG
jgi:GT2 family glycosyltransferase